MKQIRWFDRKFDFAFEQNIFPSIIERLRGTPVRLSDMLSRIPAENQFAKHDNTWSIAENIGHLNDLEPLWYGRMEDILNKEEELRHADLENKKTDAADHNSKSMDSLQEEFRGLRATTVAMLETLDEEEIYSHGLHPRLKTPMRMMDLFLFVAEHDDHHLARINELNKLLTAKS